VVSGVEGPQKWALCFVVAGGGGGVEVRDETESLVGKQVNSKEASNGSFSRRDVEADGEVGRVNVVKAQPMEHQRAHLEGRGQWSNKSKVAATGNKASTQRAR